MTTIQMTLDEDLLREVDRTVKKLRTSRSALIRDSIREHLNSLRVREMERRQRSGYAKRPVKRGEFDVWEREQNWGGR